MPPEDTKLIRGAGQQDEVGNVVLARVATAFEPVDANRVAADLLRFQRMAHAGAFVDDLDPRILERWEQL